MGLTRDTSFTVDLLEFEIYFLRLGRIEYRFFFQCMREMTLKYLCCLKTNAIIFCDGIAA